MSKCQQYFLIIIPIAMLMTLAQPVVAAPVELSVEDCTALALKNNYDIKYAQISRRCTIIIRTKRNWNRLWACRCNNSVSRRNDN